MTAERLLLDAPSLGYRAFFAWPQTVTDPQGRPVNAVRGFLEMLTRLVVDRRPGDVIAVFDADWRPAWRVAAYAGYKAERPEEPAELTRQFGLVAEALKPALASGHRVRWRGKTRSVRPILRIARKNSFSSTNPAGLLAVPPVDGEISGRARRQGRAARATVWPPAASQPTRIQPRRASRVASCGVSGRCTTVRPGPRGAARLARVSPLDHAKTCAVPLPVALSGMRTPRGPKLGSPRWTVSEAPARGKAPGGTPSRLDCRRDCGDVTLSAAASGKTGSFGPKPGGAL